MKQCKTTLDIKKIRKETVKQTTQSKRECYDKPHI